MATRDDDKATGAPGPREIVPGADSELADLLHHWRVVAADLWRRMPDGAAKDRARAAAEILHFTAWGYVAEDGAALRDLERTVARMKRFGTVTYRANDPAGQTYWLDVMRSTLDRSGGGPWAPEWTGETYADWFLGHGRSFEWLRVLVSDAERVFSSELRHLLAADHPATLARARLIEAFEANERSKAPGDGERLLSAGLRALGIPAQQVDRMLAYRRAATSRQRRSRRRKS